MKKSLLGLVIILGLSFATSAQAKMSIPSKKQKNPNVLQQIAGKASVNKTMKTREFAGRGLVNGPAPRQFAGKAAVNKTMQPNRIAGRALVNKQSTKQFAGRALVNRTMPRV